MFFIRNRIKAGLAGTAFPLAALCLVLAAADAVAYLDPATGSIILQGLLAALAGAVVTLRVYWARLKRFFTGSGKASPDEKA